MEQGQSEESLIESGERSDVGRWRNTPAGELEAIAVVKSSDTFATQTIFEFTCILVQRK